MESDDPTSPLLGVPARRSRMAKVCGVDTWKRRLPITIWLPKYNFECLLRDAVAGITVGLTSIPQGIAYAIVAGLPPQVGLYSSIIPGYMYMIFGSCKDVTVGPTAILAALLAKYVVLSADFAYLAAFLSGLVILLLGVLQLGFLLDFISKPVISAFTAAAALQIGAAQLKSLFRLSGKSGGTFITALVNFVKNIKTVHLWDTILGIISIITLFLLKNAAIATTPEDSPLRVRLASIWLYFVRARNAIVVFTSMFVAYILYVQGITPIALTGKIEDGLPPFSLPPFNTVVNNQTLDFPGMLSTLGPEGLVMPFVTVLESIAIARAFAGNKRVDSTQEMLAVGMCNIAASFFSGMPVAGSFTRTALNHASGVMTPAGAFFKASLLLLTVAFLAEAFYFIPRASLAAVIMVAMVSLVDVPFVIKLYRYSKLELLVYALCLVVGATVGLEYGILAGVSCDGLRIALKAARPYLAASHVEVANHDCTVITLYGSLLYAGAERIPREVFNKLRPTSKVVVLDAVRLDSMDYSVAENLLTVILGIEAKGLKVLLWNFNDHHQKLFEDLHPGLHSRFIEGPSIDQHIIGI